MTHLYSTLEYARLLDHIGEPFYVPEFGCAVISRYVNRWAKDAIGVYPIATIRRDADILGGLNRLSKEGFISIVFVLDDYHRPPLEILKHGFDFVRPFKKHFILNSAIGNYRPSRHHLSEIKKSQQFVNVKKFNLAEYMNPWLGLYAQLSTRHSLSGVHQFSRKYHEGLAQLSNLTAVGAFYDDFLISAHLWIEHNGIIFSHLAASSEEGYKYRSAYAVNDESLKLFSDATIINLGGGTKDLNSGITSDGLADFKKGFSNDVAISYICGKNLNPTAYAGLCGNKANNGYFPAYRGPDL